MATELHIQLLVEEILDSGRGLDEVCCDCPALLPQVRESLRKIQAVEAEVPCQGGEIAVTARQVADAPGEQDGTSGFGGVEAGA